MLDTVKPFAKRLFFGVAASAPAIGLKLRGLRNGDRLTILNFHRVGPDDRSTYPPLASALFEDAVRFCRANFTMLTFADLAGYRPSGKKPPLILSFDDGYQDFADYAVPIMKRHGVRCNINLIPACMGSRLPPLNVQVQDFVGQASDAALATLAVPGCERASGEDRQRFGDRLSDFIKAKPIAQQKKLSESLRPIFENEPAFRPAPMMSLDMARSACADHEIGAHSYEHATLSQEEEDYVRSDAERCAAFFRDRFGRPTDIYAVPNGGIRAGIAEILHEAGFRQILLTGEDYSRPRSLSHPRFSMRGASTAEVRFRATGFVRH